MIALIPILPVLSQNVEFLEHPDCQETLAMSVAYYQTIGFHPPWICYYARLNGNLVGNGAFKGRPVNGKVEIAYGTFAHRRNEGIGNLICRQLVEVARQSDPALTITARTLPEENHSTRILRKNRFRLLGQVWDPEDGEVWEWEWMEER